MRYSSLAASQIPKIVQHTMWRESGAEQFETGSNTPLVGMNVDPA